MTSKLFAISLFLFITNVFLVYCSSITTRTSALKHPTPIQIIESNILVTAYPTRVDAFKNTLQFNIKVNDVAKKSTEQLFYHSINVTGILKNISQKPVVIPTRLFNGAGHGVNVNFVLSTRDGKTRSDYSCCADTIMPYPSRNEDLIVLNPNEENFYTIEVVYMEKSDPIYSTLTQITSGEYILSAYFFNSDFGYYVQPTGIPTSTPGGDILDEKFYIADMNMWVGEVESNHVIVKLP